MRTALFDVDLPDAAVALDAHATCSTSRSAGGAVIALQPVSPRDAREMLRGAGRREATRFVDRGVRDLPELLRPGDALVFNDTRVIRAALDRRAHARRPSGARGRQPAPARRREPLARVRAAGQAPAVGDRIRFGSEGRVCLLGALDATVRELAAKRARSSSPSILHGAYLDEAIAARRARCRCRPTSPASAAATDADRATIRPSTRAHDGAVAAPTAGLHFTPELMAALEARGIARHFVTLHVGAGTFLPVKADDTADHRMHAEWGEITAETAAALNAVRARGRSHRRRRHHVAAAAGERGGRDGRIARLRRRDRHLHHARLPLPRRRRADDQLPPAALDAVHAGLGLRRPRRACRRAYAHAIARRLPLLLLRRCLPAVSARPPSRPMQTESSFAFTPASRPGRRRAPRRDRDAARRHPHAGLHAGRHGGDRQGAVRRPGARRPAPTSSSATPIT